jgi:hypothetical protein
VNWESKLDFGLWCDDYDLRNWGKKKSLELETRSEKIRKIRKSRVNQDGSPEYC